MIIDEFKINSKELEKKLFPILKCKIFHVTDRKSYTSIIRDGYIINNRDGKRNHGRPKYDNSYAQRNGLVSLFDLKNCPAEKLEHVKDSFYFYNPQFTNNNPYFFIIKDDLREKLISWEVPAELSICGEKPGMFIHYAEFFYENKLPINLIEKIVIAEIEN